VSQDRQLPLDQGARRFRRALWAGLAISVLVHVALALAWRGPAAGPGPAVYQDRGELPAAPRPDALHAVAVASEPPPTSRVPPPPAPVRAEEVRVAAPEAARDATLHRVELDPSGRGSPGWPGEGDPGSGGGEGSGQAVEPPVPRSVLPEWSPPGSVRGERITVRVFVNAHGHPAGPVELDPPTSSDEFNRRLVKKVRRMEFQPARGPEGPVAAWAELTFVF